MSLEPKAKTRLHPIFEKFRKEYSVPHSLIVDDYERDIMDAVSNLLVDAQQQLEEKDRKIKHLNELLEVDDDNFKFMEKRLNAWSVEKEGLEGRLQRIRKQWTQKLHEIKKAMIPHADVCRKCPLRKTVCSKQQKAHPSFGCNAIKNLGEAYHVLCEFERELAVLPEEVEK